MSDKVFLDNNPCQVGYYDALILSAARLGGCPVVYSEDLSSGQEYNGVSVQNPF